MNGILILDKEADWTSFDVIAKLRGVLGERRLGHGGTLDPMATGVLPVFAGPATRAVDLLPDQTKRYTATACFGIATDTGDVTGTALRQNDIIPDENTLYAAIAQFTGSIEQIPPMYSAIRIGGQRLYDIARTGQTVERPARRVEIFSCELLDYNRKESHFTLDVLCSKGTYIRTLCEDIAAAAGSLAALSALRRTASGGFGQAEAYSLDAVQAAKANGMLDSLILPIDRAFAAYPALTLDAGLERLYLNGFRFAATRLRQTADPGQTYRLYGPAGFLGLGAVQNGELTKIRQFYFSSSTGG